MYVSQEKMLIYIIALLLDVRRSLTLWSIMLNIVD